jgi:hypothetical protein
MIDGTPSFVGLNCFFVGFLRGSSFASNLHMSDEYIGRPLDNDEGDTIEEVLRCNHNPMNQKGCWI